MAGGPSPFFPYNRGVSTSASASTSADPSAVAFAVEMGRALHSYGTPAHRLEGALSKITDRLGLAAQFFSTPTGLFASFNDAGRLETVLLRVESVDVDLEKMALLDELADGVIAGTVAPGKAVERIGEIVAAPPRYGKTLTAICYGLASATTARFVGGGWREVVVALAIGTTLGLWASLVGRRPRQARVFEPLAGALATVAAMAASAYMPPVSVYVTTLAGLIVLIPGLTVTVAVSELATRNLVSGATRLVGAGLVFLMLGFGVALGSRVAGLLAPAPLDASPIPLPGWTEALAFVVSPFAIMVIFKARPRDVGFVALGAALSFWGARAGAHVLGPEFGVALGAFLLGVGTNLTAWKVSRPSAIQTVPGLMLIVPGSVGFGSVSSFLSANVVTGVEAAFRMSIIVVSLVTGLLLANAVVKPVNEL